MTFERHPDVSDSEQRNRVRRLIRGGAPSVTARIALPEWHRVRTLAFETLRTRSKDLQVAGWPAESLANVHGFAGLSVGTTIIRRLLEQYWERLYPQLDATSMDWGDQRTRVLDSIGERIARTVLTLPLTPAPINGVLIRLQHVRASQEHGEQRLAGIEDLWPTGKRYALVMKNTPNEESSRLLVDILDCRTAITSLDALCDTGMSWGIVGLSRTSSALEECARFVSATPAAIDNAIFEVAE